MCQKWRSLIKAVLSECFSSLTFYESSFTGSFSLVLLMDSMRFEYRDPSQPSSHCAPRTTQASSALCVLVVVTFPVLEELLVKHLRVTHEAPGDSQARDWIRAWAATYTADAATPDPWATAPRCTVLTSSTLMALLRRTEKNKKEERIFQTLSPHPVFLSPGHHLFANTL